MEGPTRSTTWEALTALVGREVGVSDWIVIDQPTIDAFAETTRDHHFIHVDPERAAELPLGSTIAHGFLTLSLLSNMAYQVIPSVDGARYPLNYGFDRVRFVAPVPVGSRVRAHFVLVEAREISDTQRQLIHDVTVEIEGATRPALVARWLTRVAM
jgi:acyl dehydratase